MRNRSIGKRNGTGIAGHQTSAEERCPLSRYLQN